MVSYQWSNCRVVHRNILTYTLRKEKKMVFKIQRSNVTSICSTSRSSVVLRDNRNPMEGNFSIGDKISPNSTPSTWEYGFSTRWALNFSTLSFVLIFLLKTHMLSIFSLDQETWLSPMPHFFLRPTFLQLRLFSIVYPP